MKVVAINKRTKEETTLEDNLTYEQAEKFCMEWGWSYCDENNVSYWLKIRGFAKEVE